MSKRLCGCVIATDRNTPSVRKGFEMGGYVKHFCDKHDPQNEPACKVHNLKIERKYFNEVLCGLKTFEIRKNDRNFTTGDMVRLNEINGLLKHTGRRILATVGYVCNYAQQEGYVVFSLVNPIEESKK